MKEICFTDSQWKDFFLISFLFSLDFLSRINANFLHNGLYPILIQNKIFNLITNSHLKDYFLISILF